MIPAIVELPPFNVKLVTLFDKTIESLLFAELRIPSVNAMLFAIVIFAGAPELVVTFAVPAPLAALKLRLEGTAELPVTV